MDVEFRPIAGFPGHRVGSDRSVWVEDGTRWTKLKPSKAKGRLPFVWLRRDGRRTMARPVADLYAAAFPPPSPAPSPATIEESEPTVPPVPEPVVVEAETPAFAYAPPTGGFVGAHQARGSAHGRALLDEAKVLEARRLKRQGWTYPALVERYRVGKVTLFYAISGKTWRHVPMEAS